MNHIAWRANEGASDMTGAGKVCTNEGTTTQEAGLPGNSCPTGTALPDAKKQAGEASKAGQKTSTRPPVRDEYSRVSDEWISKSTCPTGRVEFA